MPRAPKQDLSYERSLATNYVAARIAYMGADPGTPEFSACKKTYEDAASMLAHAAVRVLLGQDAGDAASKAASAAHDASSARFNARYRRTEPVTPPVAADQPQECVINCTNPQHCEGCGQHEPTTRTRIAHLRGMGTFLMDAHRSVDYCDGCAEIVQSGTGETFDRFVTAADADASGVAA